MLGHAINITPNTLTSIESVTMAMLVVVLVVVLMVVVVVIVVVKADFWAQTST
jgi:hypothetical protein